MSEVIRNELAAAASMVDDITCTPYHRQSTTPGHGSVRLGQVEYPNRFGGVVTWEVVIALGQDVAAAEKLIEAKSAALRAALSDSLSIRRLYPATATFGGSPTNVLVIEGTREEED